MWETLLEIHGVRSESQVTDGPRHAASLTALDRLHDEVANNPVWLDRYPCMRRVNKGVNAILPTEGATRSCHTVSQLRCQIGDDRWFKNSKITARMTMSTNPPKTIR